MPIPQLTVLPFLESICWQGQRSSVEGLSEMEILQLYERNWHYRGAIADLSKTEETMLVQLAQKHHSWLANEIEIRPMQFRRPIHNTILRILNAINSDFFADCSILFGGGTLLTLAYGEYRLSRDIDFLCPYGESFSRLRRSVFDNSYRALFDLAKCDEISFPTEIRAGRDGIRFAVQIEDTVLKFEIVAEGRIPLDPPSYPTWSPVACLSMVDQIAEKLLANGDRWPDRSVHSRDLIDLAILRESMAFPDEAIAKAEAAYPTVEPLKRSLLSFQSKPQYRLQCYERLAIQSPSVVIDGLDSLALQFDLPKFNRQHTEIAPT
ncbi:MAG: nucleotidyl transferase AbiEii/AbiGii toxin family protein [Cyanobacteria bacterium J06623_5]